MKQYKIVQAGDLLNVELDWQLQGGVSSFFVHQQDGYENKWTETWFTQALFREVK